MHEIDLIKSQKSNNLSENNNEEEEEDKVENDIQPTITKNHSFLKMKSQKWNNNELQGKIF